MNQSWDYARALRELWNRSSYERGLISDPFGDQDRAERGLVRMRALLRELGNPEAQVPAVHIAGSKGKGSTAAFIAAAAQHDEYRTGFYSSPHLHRFPERIAIDGRAVSDDRFAKHAQIVSHAARVLETRDPDLGVITTFEMVTAMAFRAFADAGCQLSVVEVGLGGAFDSTNVLLPLVSVITRIDLEHTAVLGSTVAEIATQKAGIIRPGIPCVSSPQLPEAQAAIAQVAQATGSQVLFGKDDWSWHGSWRDFDAKGPWGNWTHLSLGLSGNHQVENATTALAALHFVNSGGLTVSESAIRAGFASTTWPGRFERRLIHGRDVVFDAAHTPAAAEALVDTWRSEVGTANAVVVLGMGADKEIPVFLEALRPIMYQLIATRADSPRAADPAVIAADARYIGVPSEVQPTVAAAIERAMTTTHSPILVTGSLFVAGEGREAFGFATPDHEWRRLNQEIQSRTDAPKPN